MKRLACALVIAGSSCTLTVIPAEGWANRTRAVSDLRLTILKPDPDSIVDRLAIDIGYQGGTVDSVELYLDGSLVSKRQINAVQMRGIISFSLNPMLMVAGTHDVLVKAYGSNRPIGTASAKIRIPDVDVSAAVKIDYPTNGTLVSGVVPIRVFLDSQLQKQTPYVTFFVDKEFKSLRNYPPYEYDWDTTGLPNGWHLLEAWSQVDDASTLIKSRAIHVNVNNSSGLTKKQDAIEDLNATPLTRTPAPITRNAGEPTTASPLLTPDMIETAAAGLTPYHHVGTGVTRFAEPTDFSHGRVALSPPTPVLSEPAVRKPHLELPVSGSHVGTGASRFAEPTDFSHGRVALSPSSPVLSDPVIRKPEHVSSSPVMAGGAITPPKGKFMIAQAPRNSAPGLDRPEHGVLVTPTAPAESHPSAVSVKTQKARIASRIVRNPLLPTKEVAQANRPAASSHRVVDHSLIAPYSGAFDVAFDGEKIDFDVQPRVEKGIRLAPFRQIFEHTGGHLYWSGGSQTVHAVNETREIEMKIGDTKAKINNTPVPLQRAPFLDHGRTMVPLSFLKEALDVKITFDEKSGHLLIESNK